MTYRGEVVAEALAEILTQAREAERLRRMLALAEEAGEKYVQLIGERDMRLAEVERERDEWKRLHREAWQDCKSLTDWRNRHTQEHADCETYQATVDGLRARLAEVEREAERLRRELNARLDAMELVKDGVCLVCG